MGVKESRSLQLEIINRIDENPSGMCTPLAIIESLPDGFPPPDQYEEFIGKIVNLLFRMGGISRDEFWNQIMEDFWPDRTVDDIGFRSAKDPEFLNILRYVHRKKLPIIALITKHAVGLCFVETEEHGVVAEFVYGLPGERPFIPLNGSPYHDEDGFLEKEFFGSKDGGLAVFPALPAFETDIKH